jgi:hypothetical protein
MQSIMESAQDNILEQADAQNQAVDSLESGQDNQIAVVDIDRTPVHEVQPSSRHLDFFADDN